jgi:TetR/AcrR family tetracycline transcriptional repressor
MTRSSPSNPRGTITRERVLQAALEILDRDGVAGLSLRKIAAQLGVSTMSIYRHYRSKSEIEMDIVDHVVGSYGVTQHNTGEPIAWLLQTYASMRSGLCAHPGLLSLLDNAAAQTAAQGTNALAVMEAILGQIETTGLPPEQTARLFHLTMALMMGSVLLMNQSARAAIVAAEPTVNDAQSHLRQQLFEMLPADRFPHITRAAPHLARVWEADTFLDDLRLMIAAFTQPLDPPPPP